MKIEYDTESDGAFIWIDETILEDVKPVIDQELWPVELKDQIGLLFNEQKQLIGLEVLNASENLTIDLKDTYNEDD